MKHQVTHTYQSHVHRLLSDPLPLSLLMWRDGLVVSAIHQRPRGRVRWLRAVVQQPWASCSLHPARLLTQPSILSGSVNEYRL